MRLTEQTIVLVWSYYLYCNKIFPSRGNTYGEKYCQCD